MHWLFLLAGRLPQTSNRKPKINFVRQAYFDFEKSRHVSEMESLQSVVAQNLSLGFSGILLAVALQVGIPVRVHIAASQSGEDAEGVVVRDVCLGR